MVKTEIIAEDFYSSINHPKTLRASVQDIYGNPLDGYILTFTINGVHYYKTTDEYGEAELNINLPLGTYQCDLLFQEFDGYARSEKSIVVYVVEKYPVQIEAGNLTMNYGESGAVKAQVTVYDGSALNNSPILFHINGKYYTRTTDDNGEVSLNIRLPRGEYACQIMSPADDYFAYAEKTVTVKILTSTKMDGTNIRKMEDETAVYQCAVYDEIGRVDCDVRITVNGVTYVRHTESDGIARLNIRLPAGEYDIIAEFLGDSVHTGSRVVNHISSKPYMQGISEYRNGKWIPADNTGYMESKIQVKQWSPEAAEQLGGIVFWDDTAQKWHKDIPFISYEITETDPRVKTARFTSSEYFDLTDGQIWVHISSPYHENFGGRILKVEFNKDNGLYTYQCQDGRRNYLNKWRMTVVDQPVYTLLKYLLLSPLIPKYHKFDEMINAYENTGRGSKLLSGLQPIENYKIQNGVLEDNWYDQPVTRNLSYDSDMEKILNYGHNGGAPIDIYFSPEGICQLEPLHVDTWLKTGFKITHSDLTSYKYGFDTTNILTGVNFQTTDTTPVVNSDTGQTINDELQKLGFYFGANIGMISPVTESVTTTTSTSDGSTATGVNNKGKTVVVACDINNGSDGEYLGTVCSTLENAGYSVINLGIGPSYFSNYDYSGSSSGKVGVYIMAASTVSVADGIDGSGNFDYYVFGIRGDIEGSQAVSQWDSKPWGQDSDCTSICNRWSGHTSAEIAQMCRDSGKGDMVKGSSPQELANAVLAAVNGESGGGTSTTTTEQINVAETYKAAQEEVVKSGRELLNFEVTLPLNHTMFKELHTNQMLFTELPKDFKLGNLAELFKILPTYKINRGAGTEYQENRWYIEKQVIKCDSNGLFSTLTLNVLPSPYSPYTEKLRNYRDAYIQAYEQQTNTSSGEATGNLKWSTGVTDLDNLIKEAIAGKTDEYEMASAIHYKLRDAGIKYAYYYDFNYSNTAQRWAAKDSGLNCGDTAALTAEAMKAAGLEAYVSLCPGHYITVIKCSDGVHFSDLTGAEGAYSSREFDDIWSGSSKCQNPYDYPH